MSVTCENLKINIPEYALSVLNTLARGGESVYIVGGCVRDALLGKEPNDYDMAVSCQPERTMELLSEFRTVPTGIAHGTVTALSDGHPIEITTFRVDGSYTDSRRPDSVCFTRCISDDLARRDFTVNAMAYSPSESLVDLFGGIDDLKGRIIRAVGDPEKRFSEDALRIMRAFRFAAQLGFSIDRATLDGARKCREGLSKIAVERVREEFLKLILSKEPERALLMMLELEILPYVTGSYCPSEKVFGLLSRMPGEDVARLGLFLSEADREQAGAILGHLKCSNRQRSGALAISQSCRERIESLTDAAHLRAVCGEYALSAARASALLGYSDPAAEELVAKSTAPTRISELAIGGRELMSLGIKGRELGEMLESLLARVMRSPELNERERLIALADKMVKEKGKRE